MAHHTGALAHSNPVPWLTRHQTSGSVSRKYPVRHDVPPNHAPLSFVWDACHFADLA